MLEIVQFLLLYSMLDLPNYRRLHASDDFDRGRAESIESSANDVQSSPEHAALLAANTDNQAGVVNGERYSGNVNLSTCLLRVTRRIVRAEPTRPGQFCIPHATHVLFRHKGCRDLISNMKRRIRLTQ
ncbi:uncharacterized protein LOC116852440 isoform X2 [Odontomachus brunneus]|uniref:uncharacterized protein LOC116852440 isoform X2 n=1 Tax=Odontomachus brunneus TaxID=486640 RepID=UPI0013F25CF4|nr:uncharacterized protein LOC116852440 isoform X2 [Odontomachus brunneus]